MKGVIVGVSSSDYDICLKIRVQELVLKVLKDFLNELGCDSHFWFEEGFDKPGFDYNKMTDEHFYSEGKKFWVHMIFGKEYLHLIIVNFKDRELLLKIIKKYFSIAKHYNK